MSVVVSQDESSASSCNMRHTRVLGLEYCLPACIFGWLATVIIIIVIASRVQFQSFLLLLFIFDIVQSTVYGSSIGQQFQLD
jgi:hypothetical protein